MLREQRTGRRLGTSVTPASAGDFAALGPGWNFTWEDEARQSSVYKLVAEDDPGEILGFIAAELREGFVEVTLLECSPGNVGRGKRYEGIAGSLIAFAATLSFDAGHEGYLVLDSKTALIEHYCQAYGFKRIGMSHRLVLDTEAAARLSRDYP